MDEVVWRYWGKADPKVGGHHKMVLHSLDVAACSLGLLETDRVLRRKLAVHLTLDEEAVPITVAYFSALHDLGKLDGRFQIKAPQVVELLQPGLIERVPRGSFAHGGEGYRMFVEDEPTHAEGLGYGGCDLLAAVCGHHGTIPGGEAPDGRPPRSIKTRDIGARRSFFHAMSELFLKLGALTAIPKVDRSAVQIVAGVCAIADWVGSNVDWFPYVSHEVDLASYWSQRSESARIAIASAGLVALPPAASSLVDLFPGFSPRGVQCLSERLHMAEPALVIVEAEMGQGKTEAALALAARAVSSGNASGVYVALPTMATSNAMLARVEDVAPRLFPGGVQLALAHGRARRNLRFSQLIARGLRAQDEDAAEASAVCARWLLSKKRVLLAQLGVGTVDQAMHSVLRVHHQFVRMTALARSVVIIDEIHAYDSYMEVILEHAVRWLGAMEVPVVLLSATLPAERRARLIAAWKNVAFSTDAVPSGVDAVATPYPQVTEVTRSTTSTPFRDEPAKATRTIGVVLERGRSEQDVASELVAAARAGAHVAWIRNTVGEAQRAFAAVDAAASGTEVPVSLFHARFRACDRRGIEDRVLHDFGRARPSAPECGRVLVATQVVEQSLDLDFDALITDIAPIDLMLQRAGRLHRHERPRPTEHTSPRLKVLSPLEPQVRTGDFGHSAYVYDSPTLWLADDTLRSMPTWALPIDIRRLVEETYHPELRARRLDGAPTELRSLEDKRVEEVVVREAKAAQILIGSPDHDGLGSCVDDEDETVQALTRDGRSITFLILAWEDGTARSLEGDELLLDPESTTAWQVVDRMLDETLSVPSDFPIQPIAPSHAVEWAGWVKRFERFSKASGMSRVVPFPFASEQRAGATIWSGRWAKGKRIEHVAYTYRDGLVVHRDGSET